MIVTIDGPAGSGKSTTAKELARRLEFRFLDTGAMYRAVALACVMEDVATSHDDKVAEVAENLDLSFDGDRILLQGEDVTDALRSPEVTQSASIVAVNPQVRTAMAEVQRKFAAGQNIVTEGRDQGTVVFPHAGCKFFLTADPRERAARRLKDLEGKGAEVTFDDVYSQLRERDDRDERRQVAPLKPAPDAISIDTSAKTPEEVLDEMEQHVRRRQSAE